ncbi:MAG: hypothetical protein KIT20_08195 [Alphaproteobacteria bacterium]|nr:hypothetical protein [Alphaproteobacteria bacterium]
MTAGPDRAFAIRLDRLEAVPGGDLAETIAGAGEPREAATARNWLAARIMGGQSLAWYAVLQARSYWQLAGAGGRRQRAEFGEVAAMWAAYAKLAMIIDGGWCALREGALIRIEDASLQLADMERHFASLPAERRRVLALRVLEIEDGAGERAPDRWLCRHPDLGVAPEIPDPREAAPRLETSRTWAEARRIARARFARAHGLGEN